MSGLSFAWDLSAELDRFPLLSVVGNDVKADLPFPGLRRFVLLGPNVSAIHRQMQPPSSGRSGYIEIDFIFDFFPALERLVDEHLM